MKTMAYVVHALSPLHAGTGHAADIIDLPTARMKGTGIPFVPGSSVKGVLRDVRRNGDSEKVEAVFGPAADPDSHAGALVVGDARLIALPVRSFRGTFAWVTSPLLLYLAERDLKWSSQIPRFTGRRAVVTATSICVHNDYVYLEDLDLPATKSKEADAWAAYLKQFVVLQDQDIFTSRFVIVDDDTMSFLCETATQVDARVRLNPLTRTVASGALWLEESLPPETLLLGVLGADRSRRKGSDMPPEEVLKFALPEEQVLQFGGKATVGRGRCRIIPVKGEKSNG